MIIKQKLQLEHDFNDLEKIFDNRNVLYKKSEVFNDLENHIIDYITNHNVFYYNRIKKTINR